MKRSFYETPKAPWHVRMLWKCAGADRKILEKSTYSDHVKYACLGGIVLATGAMAAIAGGYAFYTIFEPKGDVMKNYVLQNYGNNITGYSEITHAPTAIKAALFGLVWGLIIFNIDRFIVASTGKGDGTEAITSKEIKSAIPRIIMGMIIALTISKPVEIRMFKAEIDAALLSKQKETREEYDKSTDLVYNNKTKGWKHDKDSLSAVLGKKREDVSKAADDWKKEMAGEGSNGKYGEGPGARAKKEVYLALKQELESMEPGIVAQVKTLESKIDEADAWLKSEYTTNEKKSFALDGLLERIKLAHEISGFWVSLFITLLFMAIELTPIFFKLMLIRSPYDYLEENVKELLKAEEGIEVQYDYYKDKFGMERNLVIHHKAKLLLEEKKELIKAQRELSDEIINKWKDKEKHNIGQNPDEYIIKDDNKN
ncbi:MAG TPA: DUF4407 domain-containing protein [Bacteroidia bacterium]|jgi:hypothetical protein